MRSRNLTPGQLDGAEPPPLAAEVLASIGEAVVALDGLGACRYANPAAVRLLGVSGVDQLVGRDMHDILHARPPEDPAAHSRDECPIARALVRGSATHITHEVFRRPDGATIDVDCRAYPLTGADGERMPGAALTLVDVTAYRKVEEENLFRKMLLDAQSEASIEGILVVAGDTKMLSFNRRAVEMWGVPQHIIDARSDELALAYVLQKLVDPQAFLAKVEYLYAHPDEESRDLIQLKDGRTFDRYSAPLRSPQGVDHGRVWFFRDITEMKQAQEEMAHLYDEARRAVRARDDFLSIASHELRTPLTSLQLATQSIVRQVKRRQTEGEASQLPIEWVKERIDGVLDLVSQLSALIDNLLDISRLSTGRLELATEQLDLAELVREVVQRHAEQLASHGCQVSVDAPGPAPGSWDRLRLAQVLTNLLSNAGKYGRGKPVAVTLSQDAGAARVTVRDNGIGIAPADRQRIFERFERAVSSSQYSGFGLGLWIVSEIVKAMGGSITVDSALGAGASFTVTLPRQLPSPK
jgi:PAS domain S-box-containing protein